MSVASIVGRKLATAATMGQVALPELRRFGYSGSLATGALAAGGTLGIMIPPSVPLVIYAILTQESIGADMLNTALALSQMPVELAAWVKASGLTPMFVMVAILVIYILLGCVMDSLAMILLTIPIFYPVVMGLEFHGLTDTGKSIWFGILALMVVEIGLVHPPVGMNVFIINRLARDVPLTETFKGVMPFLASDLVRIVLLLAFPAISLVLVRTFHA
jgi:C4-dicarboxylate transporter DctM subunit